MKEKLIKLIDVKSIVTIILAATFCYLTFIRTVTSEQFTSIFTVVIAFYFGTQSAKKNMPAGKTDNQEDADSTENKI